MLKKVDRWICQLLLQMDYNYDKKASAFFQDSLGSQKIGICAVISSMQFLNTISVFLLINRFMLMPNVEFNWVAYTGAFISVVTFVFIFMRYIVKDRYLDLSNKFGFKRKSWSGATIYFVLSLAFMWLIIISAVMSKD
jgi:hypothetical protein